MTCRSDDCRRNMKNYFRFGALSLALGIVAAASSQSVNLFQASFDIDGVLTSNTEHGLAQLDYSGTSSIQYFNLTVGSDWVIKDMPILSQDGPAVSHRLYLPFDLGLTRGTAASPMNAGFSLTATPQFAGPGTTGLANIGAFLYSFDTGSKGFPIGPIGAAAAAASGAAAAAAGTATHKDFPNQESSKNGCAPTAVSNSLKWLKAQNSLGIPDGQISLGALETALEKDDDGVFIFGDHGIVALKQKYMESIGSGITTTTSVDWPTILQAMKDGKDVELECQGHTVAVTGVTDLGGGKYGVDIAHDTKQGEAGGTIVERVTFDTGTGKFENGTWITGHGLNYAVIESVPEPTSMAAMALGLAALASRRRRKA
ncbi:PEP-CTERM sorting domain-containing protein [bacterium]|nr:MAG: PEP-CTERM sorting domain-containing protein [bacterium]